MGHTDTTVAIDVAIQPPATAGHLLGDLRILAALLPPEREAQR